MLRLIFLWSFVFNSQPLVLGIPALMRPGRYFISYTRLLHTFRLPKITPNTCDYVKCLTTKRHSWYYTKIAQYKPDNAGGQLQTKEAYEYLWTGELEDSTGLEFAYLCEPNTAYAKALQEARQIKEDTRIKELQDVRRRAKASAKEAMSRVLSLFD